MRVLKNIALSVAMAFIALPAFSSGSEPTPTKNIVEIAKSTGQFNTLLTALDAAELTETVATTEGLTVFAPTDAAFANLPAGTLDSLLADKEALKDILLYHVVTAEVPAATAVTLTEAEMANGKLVAIKLEGQDLFINASKVIAADIKASNGIIHVIDNVLVPAAE